MAAQIDSLGIPQPPPIPKFLRRKPGAVAATVDAAAAPPPPAKAGPLASPDPRYPAVYRVFLADQAPVIGCGLRLVIAKVGNKWAFLKPYSLHQYFTRSKLRRDVWENIVAGTERMLGRLARCDGVFATMDDNDPEPDNDVDPGSYDKVYRKARAKPRGPWGEKAALAQAGTLPSPPDFSAETHKRYRAKLAEVVALAQAGDVDKLKAWTIKASSSSPKAILRYRDLCLIALAKK